MVKKNNITFYQAFNLEFPRVKICCGFAIGKHVIMVFLAVNYICIENVITFSEILIWIVANSKCRHFKQHFMFLASVNTIYPRTNIQAARSPILNSLPGLVIQTIRYDYKDLLAIKTLFWQFNTKLRRVGSFQ